MRVAIVHDYIKEYGGAERVLETLHEIFPDAPVYTMLYLPKFLGPHRKRFENPTNKWDIHTSLFEYLPFKSKFISILRVISPFIFFLFDFSKYDVVIVSATGAYISNSINCHPEFISGSQKEKPKIPKPIRQAQGPEYIEGQVRDDTVRKPIHICYCHTPPRYLYGYMTARDWKKNVVVRVFGEIANHFLRLIDFKAAQNVDYFIANSEEVRLRIKKFYRRESVVIYPPVDTNSKFKVQSSKLQFKIKNFRGQNEEYYLTGGRLARAKGIDVIVEAFIKNGKPLKVFGKGFAGFERELKSKINNYSSSEERSDESRSRFWTSQNDGSRQARTINNIEYLGEVTDEEKFELMRNAKAFVFASYDEDFGITPVEAMSVGTPVVAYKSGGVQETVIEGKTGVFYNKNTSIELNKAIEKFEKLKINPKDCINQAKKFSKENFMREIVKFIDSHRT